MQAKRHILIAYFSHRGQNYRNGAVVELAQGNTAVIAALLAKMTGGTLFELEPVAAYPAAYRACTEAAQKELRASARPALLRDIDVTDYDTILLGYPNWWGTMPMAVKTFLDGHDFSGKTVLPFCTHAGSGMGSSQADLEATLPTATVLRGLAILGDQAKDAAPKLLTWLQEAAII